MTASGKWISVDGRPPEANTPVLVAQRCLLSTAPTTEILLARWFPHYWFDDEGLPLDDITHWMPLPEPPDEDPMIGTRQDNGGFEGLAERYKDLPQ